MYIGKTARRVAVLSTEPDHQELMGYKGKKRTVRALTSMRLRELGLEPIIHRPLKDIRDFPDLGKYGSVVVGGSKLDLFDADLERNEWMGKLLDFIRQAHGKVPMLGFCFGHQALGRAFGSSLERYGPDVKYEVGMSPVLLTADARRDLLFRSMPDSFEALFSHFCYISSLPRDGVALALSQNPANQSIQAFRIGSSTWGVQFHPEYPREGIMDLTIARRNLIRDLVDVDHVLRTLEHGPRVDSRILETFSRIVSMN